MPELPEVETIRRQLEKYIVGHKITGVRINYGKKFEGDAAHLIGAEIKKVHRFGKVLEIEFSNKYSLVIHIKMTGQLIYQGPNLKTKDQKLSTKIIGGVPGKHTHIIFDLDKGGILYFNDVRKFGWIKIVKSEELKIKSLIGKLGPEPLKDLTLEKFVKIIKSGKKPIKLLLMDQEKIAGVGNIYANDALWLASISPRRAAQSLSLREAKTLFDAIEKVLKKGIEKGGSSENTYVTPDGGEGEYQRFTLVYGKEGEVCERCHRSKIEKFYLSGRGTYVCPFCQKQ